MSKFAFIKTMIWVGFISLNTLIFKTWFEVSLLPFAMPDIVGTPAVQLVSTILGVCWSVFIYIAWWAKFRRGGGNG